MMGSKVARASIASKRSIDGNVRSIVSWIVGLIFELDGRDNRLAADTTFFEIDSDGLIGDDTFVR
jgi:hypothetical protein